VDWACRYEVLRRQTLEHGQAAAGWGLALLIHRGVAAWMRACSVMLPQSPQSQPMAATASSFIGESTPQAPTVVAGVACQVVHVLAAMILETR
jgi:hypothetical protein